MPNPKKKGNRGENLFSQWLSRNGITATRNSGSGSGIVKSDVNNSLGINFEVKTVKKINLLKAFKQSQKDARLTDTIPYLVIHFDGMNQDDWLMVMDNHYWLELINKVKEPKTVNDNSQELRWILKNCALWNKKLNSYLEK